MWRETPTRLWAAAPCARTLRRGVGWTVAAAFGCVLSAGAQISGDAQDRAAKLQQTVRLVQTGQYREAMTLYRQLFGANPPVEWALPYYETEAATEAGRPHAIAGLRALAGSSGADPRFAIALGKVLTYDPATRAEGQQYLEHYPNDPAAVQALGQSLLWDSANPAMAPRIRAYLAMHRNPQLAQALARLEGEIAPGVPVLAARSAAVAREAAGLQGVGGRSTPATKTRAARVVAEAPGYRVLQARRLAEVQIRFADALGRGHVSLDRGDAVTAEAEFRAASTLQPESADAMSGVAAALLAEQRSSEAAEAYRRTLELRPGDAEGRRGLVIAEVESGDPVLALAQDAEEAASLRAELLRDPGYLLALAKAYRETGRDGQAEAVLDLGLNLPLPANGRELRPAVKAEAAGVLLASGRAEQAEGLYRQALLDMPGELGATEGLVAAQAALGHSAEALALADAMEPAKRATAMRQAGFVAALASASAALGRQAAAQALLDGAIAERTNAGRAVPPELEIELANVSLQRGDAPHAVVIYRSVLTHDAFSVEAWAGLLAAMHSLNDDAAALAEARRMPETVRRSLQGDTGWLQLLAEIERATGDWDAAADTLGSLEAAEREHSAQTPAGIVLERADLLLRAGNDAGLSRELNAIRRRQDLTEAQRASADQIWAVWAVRRAERLSSSGDARAAATLLRAAASAFPGDPAAQRLVAVGYAKAARSAEALSIFRRKANAPESAGEYNAAIGSALAEGDRQEAAAWTEAALRRYPKDPEVLVLAARTAEGRGRSRQAMSYYRASLAVPEPDARPGGGGEMAREDGVADATAEWREELAVLLAPAAATDAGQAKEPPVSASQGRPSLAPVAGGRLRDYVPPPEAKGPAAPPVSRVPSLPREYGPFVPYSRGAVELRNAVFSPQAAVGSQVSQPTRRTGQMGGEPGGVSDSGQQQYPQPSSPPAPTAPPPRSGTSRRREAEGRSAPLQTMGPGQIEGSLGALPVSPAPPIAPTALTVPFAVGTVQAALPPVRTMLFAASSSRERAAAGLMSLEGSYTGWLAATGIGRYRSGISGLDRLYDEEAPVEVSLTGGRAVRLSAVARSISLSSGALRPGSFAAGSAPYLGTLYAGNANVAAQQVITGLGGELQLTGSSIGVAAGYTGYAFPVRNLTGRFAWRTADGHLTLMGERQPVRDTQLSYAGLHDPGQTTATQAGPVWGGVISQTGGARLELAGYAARVYLQGEGGVLHGTHVQSNDVVRGELGTDVRLGGWSGVGVLTAGGMLRGMHYDHNELGLSYGHGGYFSPREYIAAAAPVRFAGYHGAGLHYDVTGSLGVLIDQQDAASLFPLDPALESGFVSASGVPCTASQIAARTCGASPAVGSTGIFYDTRARVAYLAGGHWYLGGFVSATDAYSFQDVSAGFSLRYTVLPQREVDGSPSGLVPADGLRPLQLP